jgi:hypothetical protein
MVADDLSITGLVYLVTGSEVQVALVERHTYQWIKLCSVTDVLGPIAQLRDELTNTKLVAYGLLPRLTRFARSWGRSLVPAAVLANPPDVLLIVPHALLHGLPLHLVQADNGRALACCSGTSYASSPTLLLRCAARNPVRHGAWPKGRSAAGGGTDVVREGEDELRSIAAEVLGEFRAKADHPFGFGRIEARAALRQDNRVVCIIAHGYIDTDQHGGSGILIDRDMGGFAGSQINIDGREFSRPDLPERDVPAEVDVNRPADLLTLGEIEMGDPTQAELTILLACSAGESDVMQGDEPASLAEAMLRLGSVSVVAPMWDCDSYFAHAWIRPFLSAWNRRGMPKAMAAREAFLALNDGSDVAELGPIHLRGDWL